MTAYPSGYFLNLCEWIFLINKNSDKHWELKQDEVVLSTRSRAKADDLPVRT